MSETKEKQKRRIKVVYGGYCHTGKNKRGFSLFIKKNGEWTPAHFDAKGMSLSHKVVGAYYWIDSIDGTTFKFGKFEAVGEVIDPKEEPALMEKIVEQELSYLNQARENTAISALRKLEPSVMNMTLAELKKASQGNYRLRAAVKRWVDNNF